VPTNPDICHFDNYSSNRTLQKCSKNFVKFQRVSGAAVCAWLLPNVRDDATILIAAIFSLFPVVFLFFSMIFHKQKSFVVTVKLYARICRLLLSAGGRKLLDLKFLEGNLKM
jgi:hypothetical protein